MLCCTIWHRHWPIGLIYDNHTISQSARTHAPSPVFTPLKLVLHLASPPTEKLLLAPSAEACKQAFMGQLKEADFIRWGNTKRMTGLRKAEQDGLWEGIKEREFSFLLFGGWVGGCRRSRRVLMDSACAQTTSTSTGASRPRSHPQPH